MMRDDGPLVGRDAERRAIDQLLADGARLVVLHGPAGVGKSRLALEWALAHPEATGPLDLEGLRSANEITREIAAALDVPLLSGDAVAHERRVLGSLSVRGRLTLLLEACESLDDGGRAFLAAILRAAPGVRLVASSRRVLSIDGEHVLDVRPLPDREALELFVARARAARPGFAARTDDDRAILEEIVHQLDGLPLALELAAARLRVLGLGQLRALLEHRLELLTGDGTDRHASLGAALDASWELLGGEGRRALVALARFEGAFVLETAARVLAPAEVDDARRMLQGSARLDELTRASLVTIRRDESSDEDEPRFSLLESVRAYARARAPEVDAASELDTHFADAVLLRGEAMVAQSRRDPRALRNLFAETRSLDAVHAWAEQKGDDVRAIRALACLARACALRGPLTPFLEAAQRVRPRLAAQTHEHAIALLRGIGQVAMSAGRFGDGAVAYEEARDRALAVGSSDLAALFESRLASLAFFQGDEDSARAEGERALARLGPNAGDDARGRVHESLGVMALRRGELPEARAAFEIALACAEREGLLDLRGKAEGFLAWCELHDRRFPAASAGLLRASAVCASMGERRYADAFAGDVGFALFEQGLLAEARGALAGAVAAHQRRGDRWYEANHLGSLGMVVFAEGDLEEARRMLATASAMHAASDRSNAALFRALEGAVRSESGDSVGARQAFVEAQALADGVVGPITETIALLRGALALHGGDRAALARDLTAVLEVEEIMVRMPARALLASLARIEARDRAEPSEPARGHEAAPAWNDPLHAALVKLRVEQRLFGGPARSLRVGRFEVVHRIGAGAMSVVYAARDPELGRDVALKLLQDAGATERLRREARALAQLRHPHVVSVYEVGTWRQHVFVALERVRGVSLGAWRSGASRTVDEVVRVLCDVAQGLAAVHEIGLVHRDVKPDNIVVDAADRARLVDFGLVALPGEASTTAATPAASDDALTRPGGAPGTPRYMAPECRDGSRATPQSDQFSFAVTLEECLEGLAPPEAILAVVRRGRAIDPAARFPDMGALHDALRVRP